MPDFTQAFDEPDSGEDLKQKIKSKLNWAATAPLPENAIVNVDTMEITIGNFVLGHIGLQYKGDNLNRAEWESIGVYLRQLKDSLQWMIGDWANLAAPYAEQWVTEDELKQGKIDVSAPDGKYKWLADLTGYSYGYLRNLASIANIYPVSHRRDKLSWSHHQAVAGEDFDKNRHDLLDDALENHWTVHQLKIETGQATPTSRMGALMRTTVKIDDSWENAWSRMKRENQVEVYAKLQHIVDEMKTRLESDDPDRLASYEDRQRREERRIQRQAKERESKTRNSSNFQMVND